MHNLLFDPLIRVRLTDGTIEAMSLPDVYAALSEDRVAAFPALRPHQRHAWHAFLAQLGVIALHGAGEDTPPHTAADWRVLFWDLTPEFGNEEPWRLIVNDPARPAFMQSPSPGGFDDYRRRIVTPDDLDILVTAKNHDVKQTIATGASIDDWIFALIDLQTMAGFQGAGNYGIARMNGGFSARPCLGLAPADGGPGAHFLHDLTRMLAGREALLRDYSDYFDPEFGLRLIWLEPWDGTSSLDLRNLDPYFIEICRRLRLRLNGSEVVAWMATSKVNRIAAKQAHGSLGDFWTPVERKNGKALSLSQVGFRYDRLAKLLFDDATFKPPPAMEVSSSRPGRWRVIARGVAGGQGKTDGYHERNDIAFDPTTVGAMFNRRRRDVLAQIAEAQVEEIREVEKALRFSVAVAASGGKNTSELTKTDRAHANPFARRLDGAADAQFFSALESRFHAADSKAARASRVGFARRMIAEARKLLDEAIETVPCPAIRRHRARARGINAFWGRLRRPQSVFSDQPEIFNSKESNDAA